MKGGESVGYAVVPYSTSGEPYQQYIDGVTVFRTNSATFRTCQTLSNAVEMRVVIQRSVSGSETIYSPLYAVPIDTTFDSSARVRIISYGTQYEVNRSKVANRPNFFRNETNGYYWESIYSFSSNNYPGLSAGDVPIYDSQEEALAALIAAPVVTYPITYSFTNSTVSGPSEAAVGDTVTVSAVPDVDYGITDPATQILVTNNDIPVSYNWNPSTHTITFVMPDPS